MTTPAPNLASTSKSLSQMQMRSLPRVRTVPGRPAFQCRRVLELEKPWLPRQQLVPLWRLAKRSYPCCSADRPTMCRRQLTTAIKRRTTKREPLRRLLLQACRAEKIISSLVLLFAVATSEGGVVGSVVRHHCRPEAAFLPLRSPRSRS